MPERTPAEVNRLLGEKVMGWTLVTGLIGQDGWEYDAWVSPTEGIMYDTDDWHPFDSPDLCIFEITPAMELRPDGSRHVCTVHNARWVGSVGWLCNFISAYDTYQSLHATFSGALCLAVLAALEGEETKP